MVDKHSKPNCVASVFSWMNSGNGSYPVLSSLVQIRPCKLSLLLVLLILTGCQSSSEEQYQPYAEAAKPERKTEPVVLNETDNEPLVKVDPAVKPEPVLVPVKAIKPIIPVKAERPATTSSNQAYRVLIPTRKFRMEGENSLRISYDDLDLLKVLGMDEVKPGADKYFPDWLKQLDGKRVVLRGFMYPPYSETGIKRFAFARDNQICCFGRNPKIYDLFLVTLKMGVTTNYIANRPFDVAGTFYIDPVDEDGELLQMYEIRDAVVIDK